MFPPHHLLPYQQSQATGLPVAAPSKLASSAQSSLSGHSRYTDTVTMGSNWRRISETAKQKWGLSLEKNFKATSNSRNEAMFREATTFAGHLRQVEKDLTAWQRDLEGSFTNFRTIMLSPLPRVYEEGHNGQAVPSEPEPCMIGGDVQVERLTTAATETKKRLEMEVIQPIKQWMVAYRTIHERMRRLEALRLELDSRRRTVSDLQGRCERVRANLGTTRARGEVDMEITLRKMQHKEDKMQRTLSQFQEMEQTVYNSLFTLIKDTSVLRDYAAAAILIVQECFTAAYTAFEPQAMQYSSGGNPIYAAPTENKFDPKAEQSAKMKGKGSIKVDAGDTGSIRAGYDQTYEVSDNPPEAELTGSYGGNRYWTTSAAAY